MSISFCSVRICPNAANSGFSSSRCFAKHHFLPFPKKRAAGLVFCREDGEEVDLEAEIYDFMEKSGKPRYFPSRHELIEAGRRDLVDAIACRGGWLAYGWDLGDEGEERSEEDEFEFSRGCFDGRVHEQERSSSSSSSSGSSFEAEDEGGVDGILRRLEKERFLSYSDSSISSKSRNTHWAATKGDDSHHVVKENYGNSKANGVKNFLYSIHQKSFKSSSGNTTNGSDSSARLDQYHTKSHLLLLESELSSVLADLRSRDDTTLTSQVLNGKQTSVKEMHMLADSQEFVETEVMNMREKLRSVSAKKAVLEGRMALQIIEAQKIVEEKQRRIEAAQRAMSLLRTAYVAWPNSASEVLLAGSFDGWRSQRRMVRSDAGIFSLQLRLYPGQYEIKFIVDGVWKVDPLRCIVYNHGHENNLLTVL